MKRFEWIVKGLLLLFMATPMLSAEVMAQDDAYLTPSKAKELRAKEIAEQKALKKRMEEKRATEMARRKKAQAEYQEDVKDWYNRRDMKVTIEEMERNLDQLDGVTSDRKAIVTKGGKYSSRLRKFDPRRSDDVIVLQNVERVYVLDGYDYYDPWTSSYYGRDWDNGVNIIINQGTPWGYGWNYGYSRWGYPYPYYDAWDSYWYDPWLRAPWYSGWSFGWHSRYPHFYWRYNGPWGGYYGGYYGSYWNGYADGWYGRQQNRYNSIPYSNYGRTSRGYYDRASHSTLYGRALGNSTRSVEGSDYYDRSTRTFNGYNSNYDRRSYNRSYDSNTRTSRWERNTYQNGSNSSYERSTSSSPSRSNNSYNSSSGSGSGTTTTTTGGQVTRRG